MSTTKTTADLFRERGWGVGTKVQCIGFAGKPIVGEVTAISRRMVVLAGLDDGCEWIASDPVAGWHLYTPTPPIPTREEWAELWAKLKAFRNLSDARVHQYGHGPVLDLMLAIDAIAAKGGDA